MDRLDMEHLALFSLSGEILAGSEYPVAHSCLVHSFSPITAELLEDVGKEIKAAFSSGSPEDLKKCAEQPFETICQIFEKNSIWVVDVASISLDQEGDVWTQVGGVSFHSNKLRLISFRQE